MAEEDTDKIRWYLDKLHEASQMYFVAAWAIPGIFLGIQGLILQAVNFDNFTTPKNFFLLLFDFIFSIVLWAQFEKTHVWQLVLQGKINLLEKSYLENISNRIPLYSMPNHIFKNQMASWEQQEENNYLPSHSRVAVYVRVSRWFSYIMLFITALLFGLSIFQFIKLFII